MAISFTIGGTTFAALTAPTSANRYALACEPESGQFETIRYHPKGVTGNYLVRCGEAGRRIVCKLRYLDTVANVESNFKSDFQAWENAAVSIAYSGVTYQRCTLEPGGMKKIRNPVATGRGSSYVFMDAQATFICDGGIA